MTQPKELKPRLNSPWEKGREETWIAVIELACKSSPSSTIRRVLPLSPETVMALIEDAQAAHEGLVEALEGYEKAILALTDKQLIDNQPLMGAVVNGRAALAQAKGWE